MYHQDSPQTIQSMFNSIAKRYDLTNAILSLSLHKRWNRSLIRQVLQKKNTQTILVDLCAGTGDIAFEYLQQTTSPTHAYLIDFSCEMLEYAKKKAAQFSFDHSHLISFIEADVQQLTLPNLFADCVTLAYGIRNVKDPSLCMQNVFRILKPGGCFGILELTRPRYRILRFGHQVYMRTLMPILGKWLTNNREAYQYLPRTIQTFISPLELENRLKITGFINTQHISLSGGIATILIGYKPNQSS